MKSIFFLSAGLSLLLCACGSDASTTETQPSSLAQTQQQKVLVFTKTMGYRHEAIPTGVATLEAIGKELNYVVKQSEDSLVFRETPLAQYDAIIFLNTTGDILGPQEEKALESYIKEGGSFVGIHAAADTEYDWPWYGQLVGGYFDSHPNNPNLREASLDKTSIAHPATAHLEERFKRVDEWYNYKNLNPDIKVLLTLDESTYEGGTNGPDHPISWYHEFDGGKAIYIGGGHPEEAYAEPDFRKHLKEAVRWALQ